MGNSPINRNAGFSLVEVALAVLVMAVGMLTVLALFPRGLELGRENTENTRAILFADSIMNSIHAYAEMTPWSSINTLEIPTIVGFEWANRQTHDIDLGSSINGVNIYRDPDNNEEKFALAYEIQIQDKMGSSGMIKQVLVKTRQGQHRPDFDFSLYSELYFNGIP